MPNVLPFSSFSTAKLNRRYKYLVKQSKISDDMASKEKQHVILTNEAKLVGLVKELAGPKEKQQTEITRDIYCLLKSDPALIEFAIRTPDLLKTSIFIKDLGLPTTFAFGLIRMFPQESLMLFDMVKTDTLTYLPILQSIGSPASVGVSLIMGLLEADRLAYERSRASVPTFSAAGPNDILSAINALIRNTVEPYSAIETQAKRELIEKLTDNPKLEDILRIREEGHFSISCALASDEYLSIKLIELISGKPYFESILYTIDGEKTPLWAALADDCKSADKLLEAIGTLPTESIKRLLYQKVMQNEREGIYLAQFFAMHFHSATNFQRMLTGSPSLMRVMDLECDIEGRRMTIRNILEETTDSRNQN